MQDCIYCINNFKNQAKKKLISNKFLNFCTHVQRIIANNANVSFNRMTILRVIAKQFQSILDYPKILNFSQYITLHVKRLAHLARKITSVLTQYLMQIPVLTKTESLKQYFAILNLLILSVTDKYSKNLYTE